MCSFSNTMTIPARARESAQKMNKQNIITFVPIANNTWETCSHLSIFFSSTCFRFLFFFMHTFEQQHQQKQDHKIMKIIFLCDHLIYNLSLKYGFKQRHFRYELSKYLKIYVALVKSSEKSLLMEFPGSICFFFSFVPIHGAAHRVTQ